MSAADTGFFAAFVAGLVTSVHCLGMCGPLACAVCVKSSGAGSLSATAAYHGLRVFSYGVAGFFAGLVGRAVADVLFGGAGRWLTWAFVVFFVLVATGLDKRVRVPPVGSWMGRCLRAGGATPGRAGVLGFFTPLIPCGPLHLMIATAALSGSAISGAGVMLAFALGTVPLLLALQSQCFRVGAWGSPRVLDYFRRGLAVVCVGLLVHRGLADTCLFCS